MVFQYVKSEEFMLQAIINKDFGKMRKDYADDTAFEPGLSEKTVYMLSQVRAESGSRVCVLPVPTSVPGGLVAVPLAAASAFSRLYLYVHFPTDVLASVVLGTFIGWCAVILLRKGCRLRPCTQKKPGAA